MTDPVHKLDNELRKAVTLRELLAGENWSEGDILSALETETDLSEALSDLDAAVMEDEIQLDGLKSKIDQLTARYARIDKRREATRRIIIKAMEQAGLKTIHTVTGTITLGQGVRNAVVLEEALIPKNWFKNQAPTLDKASLAVALRAGTKVDGCTLDNGKPQLTIRRS